MALIGFSASVPSVDRRSSGPLRWQKKMSCCELFEFSRADLAERRMPTPLVIEHFDVIDQLHLGVAAAMERRDDPGA